MIQRRLLTFTDVATLPEASTRTVTGDGYLVAPAMLARLRPREMAEARRPRMLDEDDRLVTDLARDD